MRILVVDDEKLMCASLTSLLASISRDFEITSFSGQGCAKKAIEWLDHNKPDYCIFDVLLNGISGLDLAKYTFKLYGSSTKVQLITGCALDTTHYADLQGLVNKYDNMTYALKRETSDTSNFVDTVINGVTAVAN